MFETPQQIASIPFELKRLKKIAGGGSHTIFLLSDGQIFGCGWNHKGQLALQDTADHPNITELTNVRQVTDVACGWDSTAAIDPTGSLLVWGSNAFGQLGFSATAVKFTVQPLVLPLPNGVRVRRVCFGLRHLAIWTNDDDVYFTGRIKFADKCTTLDWNGTTLWKLNRSIGDDGPLRSVASGQNHFVYAKEERGKTHIYGIGDNRFGQCETVEWCSNLSSLQAGWTHNAAVFDDGHVLLWGRNSYGQLAAVDTISAKNLRFDCDGHRVEALHLGSEHGLAVCDTGGVFTWGWNEHGNCGNGTVDDVYGLIVDLRKFRLNI